MTVNRVYKDLPSSRATSVFIQAYRLVRRIIHHGGDNRFLSGNSGGIRTGVCEDVYPTDKGLVRKDGRVFLVLNIVVKGGYVEVEELAGENGGVDDTPALVAESICWWIV